MSKTRIIKRYHGAKLLDSAEHFKINSHGAKGISPQLCPAIRDFHSTGLRIYSPVEINFRSKRDFDVDFYRGEGDDYFLVPGVIGDKRSQRLYARVDTGYSIQTESTPFLAIKCQDEDDFYSNFEVAPVIYQAGYSGPILIAVSSTQEFKLSSTKPILHLLPLNPTRTNFDLIEDYNYKEPKFEGIFSNNWELKHEFSKKITSEDVFNF